MYERVVVLSLVMDRRVIGMPLGFGTKLLCTWRNEFDHAFEKRGRSLSERSGSAGFEEKRACFHGPGGDES